MIQWVTAGDPPTRIPTPGIELKLGSSAESMDEPKIPALGADTKNLLQGLGFDASTIEELFHRGVVV